MGIVESAASRLIPPLSALLEKPLCLVDAHSPEASQSFAIRFTSPRLCIVSAEGSPFSEQERRLLSEIFEVLRFAGMHEAKYQELERRLLELQRENVDLSVENRSLSEVASRDSLTGLYNRWYVIEKIDNEISRALRNRTSIALIMLDLDHFKKINDQWGHPTGDHVLQTVGKTLRESCRVYDVPGRYGGEEFCVLLPEIKGNSTTAVAERIRERLESTPVPVGDGALRVTASLGVAELDPAEGPAVTPAVLLDRADRALYSAKSNGRNRVEVWDAHLWGNAPRDTNH